MENNGIAARGFTFSEEEIDEMRERMLEWMGREMESGEDTRWLFDQLFVFRPRSRGETLVKLAVATMGFLTVYKDGHAEAKPMLKREDLYRGWYNVCADWHPDIPDAVVEWMGFDPDTLVREKWTRQYHK